MSMIHDPMINMSDVPVTVTHGTHGTGPSAPETQYYYYTKSGRCKASTRRPSDDVQYTRPPRSVPSRDRSDTPKPTATPLPPDWFTYSTSPPTSGVPVETVTYNVPGTEDPEYKHSTRWVPIDFVGLCYTDRNHPSTGEIRLPWKRAEWPINAANDHMTVEEWTSDRRFPYASFAQDLYPDVPTEVKENLATIGEVMASYQHERLGLGTTPSRDRSHVVHVERRPTGRRRRRSGRTVEVEDSNTVKCTVV
ncbi:hypothetical protein IAT38_006737 [Cryptococcus sp. DSM 104549]